MPGHSIKFLTLGHSCLDRLGSMIEPVIQANNGRAEFEIDAAIRFQRLVYEQLKYLSVKEISKLTIQI